MSQRVPHEKRSFTMPTGLVALVFLCWLVVQPARAAIELSVTRVGVSAANGDLGRVGSWLPIIVDIALVNQAALDGTLRAAQFDNDGDEVFDVVNVHLRADTGGVGRYYLYVLFNPARTDRELAVELFDQNGEAVQVLCGGVPTYRAKPAQPPNAITHDEILILSLSTSTMGRVRDLVARDTQELYERRINVAHMSPLYLPELWIGLEMIDFIVWDEADPDDLTPRQLDALLVWVRHGGTLVLAASRTAGSIVLNQKLASAIPVTLGEVHSVDNLLEARQSLLGEPSEEIDDETSHASWEDYPYVPPIPVVQCTRRDNAVRIPRGTNMTSDLITEGRLAHGRIIFFGVTLRDFLSGPGSAVDLYRKLFNLRVVTASDRGPPQPVSLFNRVVDPISFSARGSLYLLAAAVFSIGYVIVATFGTWGFLSAKKWRQHSWSLFAVVAAAASFLSIVAVNWLQGFGERLHQISVIDVEAGESYGYGTVFFGLKTSSDKRLDVWLPSDHLAADKPLQSSCFLRPLPAPFDRLQATVSFADPIEYRTFPGSAVIENVRFRATLKQFEGRWSGPLGGRVTGALSVRGRWLTDDSYVVNELGVDLHDCWLLHAIYDSNERVGSPSELIYAFPLGDLPADGGKVKLAPLCYSGRPGEDKSRDAIVRESTLTIRQQQWERPFLGLLDILTSGRVSPGRLAQGQERSALMLLSTLGDFDVTQHTVLSQPFGVDRTWSRDRLASLDLAHRLQKDSAVLVGFADTTGPARLFYRAGGDRFRMLKPDPDHVQTMYRIRLPVEVLDRETREQGEEKRKKPRVK